MRGAPLRVFLRRVRIMQVRRARASLRVLHCRVGVLLVRACVAACVALSFCREQVRACVAACVAPSRGRAVGGARVPAAVRAFPAAPSRPDCRLRGSLGCATGQLCDLLTTRIGPGGDQERPSGADRPAAGGAAGGPRAKPQAARLTRESKWAALRATNLADRPKWRPVAPTGSDLGVS